MTALDQMFEMTAICIQTTLNFIFNVPACHACTSFINCMHVTVRISLQTFLNSVLIFHKKKQKKKKNQTCLDNFSDNIFINITIVKGNLHLYLNKTSCIY